MTKRPSPKPKRVGRPSRAVVSAKALKGVAIDKLDPIKTLRSIAADTSAPASARVAACRQLLAVARLEQLQLERTAPEKAKKKVSDRLEQLSERTLKLLEGGKR
jgi:hypothetical protein